MSTLKVLVVEVDIEAHPNADRLDVVKPRGMAWQCVTAKGNYTSGDKAIYIPVDSVLPEELVKKLGIENYYSKKLRTVKLRGLISQGMVAPLSILPPTKAGHTEIISTGADVAELLGITKWDPPIPIHMTGKIRSHDSRFIRYTDIENYKNYPNVFEEGELVCLTEKIHGSNGRAANIEGEIHVGSHRMDLVEDETNLYWRAANLLKVKEKLQPGEQVFYEVYGHKVQDLSYGGKPGEVHVGVFDFMKNGIYVGTQQFLDILLDKEWDDFKVPTLPQKCRNWSASDHCVPWSTDLLKLAEEDSIFGKGFIREGFVITPIEEEHSVELQGRKILKVIGDRYHLRKKGTENH